MAQDFRVMRSDRGFFCLPEVDLKVPFSPGVMGIVKERIETQVLHEAILTGRRIAGEEAVALRIADVTVPAELTADAKIGKRAFEAKCAECHGANAAGRNGLGPPLVHKIYEPSHHSDMAFIMAVKTGVRAHHWRFGNMPPIGGVTDAEVKLITRYVRELQEENGIF